MKVTSSWTRSSNSSNLTVNSLGVNWTNLAKELIECRGIHQLKYCILILWAWYKILFYWLIEQTEPIEWTEPIEQFEPEEASLEKWQLSHSACMQVSTEPFGTNDTDMESSLPSVFDWWEMVSRANATVKPVGDMAHDSVIHHHHCHPHLHHIVRLAKLILSLCWIVLLESNTDEDEIEISTESRNDAKRPFELPQLTAVIPRPPNGSPKRVRKLRNVDRLRVDVHGNIFFIQIK